MADAFGGRVEKSAKGWGLGLHTYAVHRQTPWMDGAGSVDIPVSHQDQVIAPPPSAEVLGGNAFTPNGMLSYAGGKAISFQFHPEFDNAFAGELVELRRPHLPIQVRPMWPWPRCGARAIPRGWPAGSGGFWRGEAGPRRERGMENPTRSPDPEPAAKRPSRRTAGVCRASRRSWRTSSA